MSGLNIQPGHIARHTPRGAGAQGREAAVIDVAQDLLLIHMDEVGLLDGLAIKGGTAIRKLYAGREGRFSLDLDFAELVEGAGELFVMEADGLSIGPFSYGVTERRGVGQSPSATRLLQMRPSRASSTSPRRRG